MPSELQQALADERAAHWTCVEMLRDLRAENERLRAALQWIEAQVGQKDAELVRAMCKRALAGKDPANIYVEQ